jgi:ABC-type glutathione transport system ATPase component
MKTPRLPLLALRGLELLYPDRAVPALDALSLEWREGEALGLVGESGSGKSSLVRVAIGARRPDRGELIFRGQVLHSSGLDHGAVRTAFRQAVQPLFQSPGGSLDPRMTLFESLAEALRFASRSRSRRASTPPLGPELGARVEAGLAEVGLDADLATRFPHELSGGQRQRAALARILALRPEALILDEPTSALDSVAQAALLALLARIREERGLAVLLVSHDLALVQQLADRVAVIHSGRIVECAETADLYANPRHPYTRALLDAARAAAGTSIERPQEEDKSS